jgi:hypothetical protein
MALFTPGRVERTMAETELDETGECTRPSIAIDITLGREPYDQAAHPAMLVKTAMMDGCTITNGIK